MNNPRFPVYVISKGRHESRLTVKALDRMNVPFHVVIEPQEYDLYASVIPPHKLKVLPFSNLGQGSIPARNWVWDDSIACGHEYHWIMDDNIREFYRLNKQIKYRCDSGNIFYAVEEFMLRYMNIAISGLQYEMFVPRKKKRQPLILNTRIYSCILIRNDIPYRWRGRYNEDTDLCLRVLKDGWVTVLFQAFLADKMATLLMKGGNTDELYAKTNNRYEFAKSLRDQHPDVVKIVQKYGRWHHEVDYSPFKKNKPVLRPGVTFQGVVNNFGMELVKKD